MAGGVGVRFWPYSRNSRPKQFLDVMGIGKTLLQSTFERYLPICEPGNIFVVTSEEQEDLVREQLPQIDPGQILSEPMRKNTAPCIAYAAHRIHQLNPQAVIVVSPADHLILNEKDFQQTVLKSAENAFEQDILVTLGIQPNRPETGYGYIQYIESKSPLKKVKTFTEKPELSLAKKFVESGEFVWNAGIFIWSVASILKAFEKHLPEMHEIFQELEPHLGTPEEKAHVRTAYGQCKNISIDYGIMEKADNVFVWLSNFAWSDLGSWSSLHELSSKDSANNSVNANALIYDSRNCIVRGPQDKLIVVQGLNGFLIGSFDNVIIVCEKDKEELFRRYVSDLKSRPDGAEYI